MTLIEKNLSVRLSYSYGPRLLDKEEVQMKENKNKEGECYFEWHMS